MAHGFRRRGDRYVATMDQVERSIVAGLLEQTRELLAPRLDPTGDPFEDLVAFLDEAAAPSDEDRDPALRRLLPDAHRGDPQLAADFRRLTEHDLRSRKTQHLTTAIDAIRSGSGEQLALTRGEAHALVVGLTDTRLLLGERLGLRTDEDVEDLARYTRQADSDDPVGHAAAVYDFLTWLQETLTTALSSRRRLG